MDIYYHITKKKNIDSIIEHGLFPGLRKGMTLNRPKQKHVFVTNDVKRIIETQAGRAWCDKHEAVVLEVEITCDNPLEPVEYRDGMTYTISDFEFRTNKISKYRIKGSADYKNFL